MQRLVTLAVLLLFVSVQVNAQSGNRWDKTIEQLLFGVHIEPNAEYVRRQLTSDKRLMKAVIEERGEASTGNAMKRLSLFRFKHHPLLKAEFDSGAIIVDTSHRLFYGEPRKDAYSFTISMAIDFKNKEDMMRGMSEMVKLLSIRGKQVIKGNTSAPPTPKVTYEDEEFERFVNNDGKEIRQVTIVSGKKWINIPVSDKPSGTAEDGGWIYRIAIMFWERPW